MRILDLDLDFFVTPIHHWQASEERLSSSEYLCANAAEVEEFLEEQCGLSKSHRIPGRFIEEHDAAYDTWRDWIAAGSLMVPFEVVHVDAHADMGLGDSSYIYLLEELLALPIEQRRNPRRGTDALNPGSYLPFAIANHWLSSLTYVYPPDVDVDEDGVPNDIHPYLFRGGTLKGQPIQLPHYPPGYFHAMSMSGEQHSEPIHWEPPVASAYISSDSFSSSGFTHMVLARSPGYTPATADALIPVIEQYFYPA